MRKYVARSWSSAGPTRGPSCKADLSAFARQLADYNAALTDD